MIRQTLSLLAAVMGAVLVLFSFCLERVEASPLDRTPIPEIRARITLASPLAEADLLGSVEALIAEYPEAFAGSVRPVSGSRALPLIASRDGGMLDLTFVGQPRTPLTELGSLRVEVWDTLGLVSTIPMASTIELEGERVVATRQLSNKSPITSGDVALAWVPLRGQSGKSSLTDLSQVLGMTPLRALAAGQMIDLKGLQQPLLVTRGASVRVAVIRGGLLLETTAIALQSGSRGATISLKNPETGNTLIARITGLNQAIVE